MKLECEKTQKVLDYLNYLQESSPNVNYFDRVSKLKSKLSMVNYEDVRKEGEILSNFISKELENKDIVIKEYDYSDLISNLNKIDDISELEDEQILKLKEKLRELDSKLKEKAKPKTITISNEAHNIIKNYCSDLEENIGEWSEKILLDKISCPEIILIDSPTYEINGKLYICGVSEVNNLEDFYEVIKNKTVYLYSIGRKSEGISMNSDRLIKIRYFAI